VHVYIFAVYENRLTSLVAVDALINIKIGMPKDSKEERNNVEQNRVYSR
jgi:hypothetical protein